MALIGKVIAMTGVANIIDEKGDKRALTPGDQVQTGDSIQTTAGVTVDVQLANGRVVHIGSDQMLNFTPELAEVFSPAEVDNAVDVATIDTVIDAIENGRDINEVLEATAAGAGAGTDGSHSAVYLQRITELLNPLAFPDDAATTGQLPTIQAAAIIPPSIGGITGDTQDEGTSLVHTVTIVNGLGVSMTFPFSITFGTASAADVGTPIFSNGVVLNAAGDTITVPGGVTSFTITIPTVVDNIVEGNETYTINVGTISAPGVIVDTTTGPQVQSVEPGAPGVGDDAVPEGTDLVFNVTLTETTTGAISYPFVLGGGTATAGDIGTPTFSNGVTFDPATGLITVPAGVLTFAVTVPTIADGIVEGTTNETLPLTIGGVTGVGQIIDPQPDPTVTAVEPAGPGAADDAVPEGTNLVYNVTLSGPTSVDTVYAFNLGGGTAAPTDIGAPIFSNGVTFDPATNTITVPAGVSGFSVTVPTVQDTIVESGPNETVPLTIGGVTGIGEIIDDDVVVTSVEPAGPGAGDDAVPEGTDLVYNVTLSGPTLVSTVFPFDLGGGTAADTDFGVPTFSNGVTFDPTTNTITIPAGVSAFTVTVPTVQDTIVEDGPNETVPVTIGGVTGIGEIIDDDIIVTAVNSGAGDIDPATNRGAEGSTVIEGAVDDPLLFTVTLNKPAVVASEVTISLSNGTGEVGVDTTTPLQVSFDNGVTFTEFTGTTITVPVGVSSFIVSVPTVADTLVENEETIFFTASTVSNSAANTPAPVAGTILDDDIIVTAVNSGAGDIDPATNRGAEGSTVIEGAVDDPLLFTVTLNKPAVVASEVTISLSNGTGEVGVDTTTPLQVSFDNGVTFTEFTGTTITVPVGVSSFIVSVPTVADTLVENEETIFFTASTVSNSGANTPAPVAGTILDDDIIVTAVNSGAGDIDPATNRGAEGSTVIEGAVDDPLLFTVTLNKPAVVASEVTISLSNGTGEVGVDTTTPLQVSFDNGVTFTEFTGTTITVPVGVSSFIVSVPTVADTLVENEETIFFTASTVSNSAANTPAPVAGTILDDDIIVTAVNSGAGDIDPATNRGAEGSTVIEGAVDDPLLFTVTLNKATVVASEVTISLSNGTGEVGVDTTTPLQVSFDNGVTFTEFTGTTITVPVGVSSFIVSVPTVADTLVENEETIFFTASTVSNSAANTPAPVAGTILDDDIIVTAVNSGAGDIDPATNRGTDGSAVFEGESLLFTVTLNKPAVVASEVTISLSNGTGEVGVDTTTPLQVSFDNGVTFTEFTGTTVTVPVGVSSFIVGVPTVLDNISDNGETIQFTASTPSNTLATDPATDTPAPVAGTILDDDLIVTKVNSGAGEIDPATNRGAEGSSVFEGENLLFTVTLNKQAVIERDVTIDLSNGTGEVGVDTTTPLQVSFDNGITFTEFTGNKVTVPVGSSSFIVSVPTVVDGIDDNNETIQFTAFTSSNTIGLDPSTDTPAPVSGVIFDTVLPTVTGLTGQYFGYNDDFSSLFNPTTLRIHGDDNSVAESQFDTDNLNSISDIEKIINGRNGSSVVGTSEGASAQAADASFVSTGLSYGLSAGTTIDNYDASRLTVTANLGSNVVQAAGESLSDQSALNVFLGGFATNAVVQPGSVVTNANGRAGVTEGMGVTSDSIIRLTGSVFLERGNYDFRVLADDGFRFKVGGETLMEFDGNQSPTVREYTNLRIGGGTLGEGSGLTPIELIYWEQGQNGVLRVEFKPSSETEYKLFSIDNVPMFGDEVAIDSVRFASNQSVVNENAGTNLAPNWVVKTGDLIVGDDAGNTLTGTALNDNLRGLGSDDVLIGNAGNDRLNGGAGNDDMRGGAGDDIYVVDSAGDIVTEAFGEGIDTIDLDEGFIENYALGDNIENLNVLGAENINIAGNALNNRIVGGAGQNTINAGDGDDRIIGGAGSDILTGGAGKDVFEWNLADAQGVGVPTDRITDFQFTANGTGSLNEGSRTDAIDLRDLLQGESSNLTDANFGVTSVNVGNLQSYLNFEVEGTSTVLNISSAGNGTVDQKIIFEDVNLFDATGAGLGNQTLLIQNLLANGTLIVD